MPFSQGPVVTMYTCGITPYDATHLGHATVFLFYDVLQRRLRDLGHDTKCVRNVTDVDDPLFAKARELGVHYLDLAAAEEARFDRDMDALDVLPAYSTPRASSAIPDIRGFIGMVLDRGFAYQAGGAVYFDVSRFPSFGSVSHYDEATMLAYAAERGGNLDDAHKRHPLDFVLWQPSADDEPSWETMWGPGRPGWHIECSALALRELGSTVDLHGGGTDLIFPHHECERAAVRGGDRGALRPPLDARRHGLQGRREDVEEPGQPGVRRPAPRDVGPAGHPAGRDRAPLPGQLGVGRGADAAGGGRLDRWLGGAGPAGDDSKGLAEVRDALDDDLDTPAALAAVDDAVARGEGVLRGRRAARGRSGTGLIAPAARNRARGGAAAA